MPHMANLPWMELFLFTHMSFLITLTFLSKNNPYMLTPNKTQNKFKKFKNWKW